MGGKPNEAPSGLARRLEDVSERLVAMGLDAEAAETYLRLLMRGPIRAREFALLQRVSRSGAYRRLERLVDMGLATAGTDRPVIYEAADPATLFQVLHGIIASHAEEVEQAMLELEPLAAVFAKTGTHDGRTFRHLIGRKACNEELHRMLDGVTNEVLWVDTNPTIAWVEQMAFWTRLQQLAHAGVRQQVVIVDGSTLPSGAARIPVKILPPSDTMRFVIIDRKSTLVCITNDESTSGHAPLEQCLSTSASGLVAAQLMLFERLWAESDQIDRELPPRVGLKAPESGWPHR